jgi:hypothetical protein
VAEAGRELSPGQHRQGRFGKSHVPLHTGFAELVGERRHFVVVVDQECAKSQDPATSGSRTTSRDRSVNQGWNSSVSWTGGTSWSDAASVQRVYEYIVEPGVLQNLPENALLLADSGRSGLRAVECHPAIITMPGVSTRPFGPLPGRGQTPVGGMPDWGQIEPRQNQWAPPDMDALAAQPLPHRHRGTRRR